MVASTGVIASPAQGVGHFERDGYYAKDDPAHREANAWTGNGAPALGHSGPVDSDTFRAIMEGRFPDGPNLGKRGTDGERLRALFVVSLCSRALTSVPSWARSRSRISGVSFSTERTRRRT